MIWKKIFDDYYEVSEYGDLRRIKPDRMGRFPGKNVNNMLKPYKNQKTRYFSYMTTINKKQRRVDAHVLVALAFWGPRLKGMVVNHIDFNRTNNHYSNLEYVTHAQNLKHSRDAGRMPAKKGEDSGMSKLTNEIVINMRNLYPELSTVKLGRMYGVDDETVRCVVKGKTWRHLL